MPVINRDDIFRTVLAVVLSLLAYIGNGIRSEQADISCKVRSLELNQVRIMERLGVDPVAASVGLLRLPSQKPAPG